MTESDVVKMVRPWVFHTVGGSVPKKYVGMYRCVLNIKFCIMLKGPKS